MYSASLKNTLLAGLPSNELDLIRPHLDRVDFTVHQVLFEPRERIEHAWFMEAGVVSLTADTGDSAYVEVGMTGSEGFVGALLLLNPFARSPYRAIVQVAGSALRITADALHDMLDHAPTLRARCLHHLQSVVMELSQTAACNARHALPARLARWLLTITDRAGANELPMTQEFLSNMLGVRRAGVSVVAGTLQAKGLIHLSRGRIRIVNRPQLEQHACSCHRTVEAYKRALVSNL